VLCRLGSCSIKVYRWILLPGTDEEIQAAADAAAATSEADLEAKIGTENAGQEGEGKEGEQDKEGGKEEDEEGKGENEEKDGSNDMQGLEGLEALGDDDLKPSVGRYFQCFFPDACCINL
jgi:hypothetical protein